MEITGEARAPNSLRIIRAEAAMTILAGLLVGAHVRSWRCGTG